MVTVLPKSSPAPGGQGHRFLLYSLCPTFVSVSVSTEASAALISQSQFIFLSPALTTPILFPTSSSLPVHGGTWPALPPPFLPFRLAQPISQGLCWFPGLGSERITDLGCRSRAHPESQIGR